MKPYYQDDSVTLYHGDALDRARELPDGAVDCIVTSPPYFGLRDYGTEGQYGLEPSPAEYVETMRALFSELRRVLADDGTLWLNLGDCYSSRVATRTSSHQDGLFPDRDELKKNWKRDKAKGLTRMPSDFGLPEKNLVGIPWRVAFALQDDGWILRNAIVWNKPNAMPESVTDRLSSRYEHVFLFSKARKYWFDLDPIRVKYDGDRAASRRERSGRVNKANSVASEWKPDDSKGRNPGDVWTIPTTPFPGSHFATFPQELPRLCILAGCKPGGVVLDPFHGSGTTGLVALGLGRRYVGIDINAEYLDLSLTHPKRLAQITTEVAI